MTAVAAGLMAGAVVDAAVGDPSRGHPVALLGGWAERLERRCWRDGRRAGALYLALTAVPPTVVLTAGLAAVRRWPPVVAALTAATAWAALGARSLAAAATEVAAAVEAGDLPAARAALPSLCGRDADALDVDGVCRAAVESVAENASDAVVGTLWWGAVAGPVGIAGHRAVNTLDAMVGHPDGRHARFGWAAARADDVLGWVPARLTVGLVALLAPSVGGNPAAVLRTARQQGAHHPSPNAGRCEAAMAGALDVTLGGPTVYKARTERRLRPPPRGCAASPSVGRSVGGSASGGSAGSPLARFEQRGPFGHGPAPTPATIRQAVRLLRAVTVAATLLAAALAWLVQRGHR